jgi:predicted site-specific integrase-resolvase
MDNENYISPNKITKQYDITSGTLRRWAEAGKIRCLRPNGGKRIYNIEDIKRIFNNKPTPDHEKTENTKENAKDDQNTNTVELDDDIKNVLKKLKQNIEAEKNMNCIDDITTELNDIMILINHIKKNEN